MPATATLRAPQTYTPRHLAARILTSREALEGERKHVTVLLADLKGSMELLADRDPEEARRLLDPVLEHMMEAVHHYEGTVNQVMGDGIMALFGAPLAHEDHAVRACYAALRMQERVARYADQIQRSHGVPVQIRIGLNSGDVVVRSIGSDLHMDYTAVGQTTHLAARMEQMAKPGSSLLTPPTLRLAEGYVRVRSLGPVPVRGLADPVEVFELLAAAPLRTRLQVSAARGLTRFIGREAEMDQLRRALERARAGRGQVVAVVGEPGVGKSRLVLELVHSHRTEDWLVLESSAVSYGKTASLRPVVELLRTYFGVEDRDDARRVRERLTGKLLTLDEALRPALSPLQALLGLPVDDAAWSSLGAEQQRHRVLDAVRRVLLRESQTQPLMLVVEDLQWIDADTQMFSREPRREPAVVSRPAPGELSARAPPRLGWQDLLRPGPARSAGARVGRRARRGAPGGRSRAGAAPIAPDRAGAGQSLLPRGEHARPGGDGCARRRARRLSPGEGRPGRPAARHGAGDPRRAHRSSPARGEEPAPVGRRSSVRTCRCPSFGRSPGSPRTT
jgi:class 3 adenylate cyclase